MHPGIPAVCRLAVGLSALLLGCGICSSSAQTVALVDLPDAPEPFSASSVNEGLAGSPMGAGVMLPVPAPTKPHRAGWRSPMALSAYALAASEAFDMVETHRTLSHPQWICGTNPQMGGGSMIVALDPGQLPTSVDEVCGSSPAGQAPNYAYEGFFQESGWTTQLHLAAPRNFGAVLGWNLALDVSEAILPVLERHRWSRRTLLITELTNVAHTAAHVYGGMTNLNRLDGPAGSPNRYFDSVSDGAQLNALFPGPRWWGRK